MSARVLTSNKNGRVLELTLNRADALNAFNDALYLAFAEALRSAEADTSIAGVLLTGAGRAFSAGQDIAELGDARSHEERQRDGFTPFIEALESFSKPLIAAVNGLGVGIGTTLLLHCDLVIMGQSGRLRVPFTALGLTAEAGSSQLLADRIGWQKAADMLYTSRWMNAEEAVECGLALKCVADTDLLAEARQMAGAIAAMPVASLQATKRILLEARLDATRAARARENEAFAELVGGPANREALAAMAEKRVPDFSGM